MKIESKLFSELRGKLAETAAQMRKGKIVLSKLGIPYHVSGAERSASQKSIWQKYGKIVEDWSKLSPAEKAVYTAQGALLQISGWNIYVQENMIWDGLPGWAEKKVGTISGSTAGAQTNYQMRIKAWRGSGTSSGENVYLGTDVRDDFGDVRFTAPDGQTQYDYWMESKVDGSYAIFWIEIPSIPIAPGTTNFWLQHGNPTATTISNGTNTFELYSGYHTANEISVLSLSGAGGYAYHGKIQTAAGTQFHFGLADAANDIPLNGVYALHYLQNPNQHYSITTKEGVSTINIVTTPVYTADVPNIYKVIWYNSSLARMYQDDIQIDGDHITNIPIVSIGMFNFLVSGSGQIVHYAFVRKYISPEPGISSWL